MACSVSNSIGMTSKAFLLDSEDYFLVAELPVDEVTRVDPGANRSSMDSTRWIPRHGVLTRCQGSTTAGLARRQLDETSGSRVTNTTKYTWDFAA